MHDGGNKTHGAQMAQLSCKNVTLGYGGTELVKDLHFELNAGDYLCIAGENGSGKSTLIKTLLGLQAPLSGTISTGDGLKPTEIGYLPQQTVVQRDFPASVREIVLSGCQARGGFRPFYSSADKAAAARSMVRMDITTLARRCYRELSGGQQQRVLLARALCAAEKLLVLDEPVTGLDPKAAAEMYRRIADLNQKDGISIIMVSHDIHAAVASASHILHIGKEVFFGTKDEYCASSIGRLYLAERKHYE